MTVPGNVSDIISKVRKVTGRPSANQISDSDILGYINTFYLYDLPEHLRLLNLKTYLEFTIQPGQDQYAFDTTSYVSITTPAYMSGYEMLYYQSPEQFYAIWPQLAFIQQIATATGVAGVYTGTVTNVPIVLLSVFVYANNAAGTALTLSDNGLGSLVDSLGNVLGSVNYSTGAISITKFDVAGTVIPAGNTISVQCVPYAAARPTDVLFFDDNFVMRPVPDQAYQFKIVAYQTPTALLMSDLTGYPLLKEWWQLLALGASKKIFEDNANFEQLSLFKPILDEYMCLVQRRTLVQKATQRAATPYSGQENYPLGNFYPLS